MARAKKKRPTQLKAEARKAASAGRVDEAIERLKDVLEQEPGDAKTASRLGDLYAGMDDVLGAVHYFRRAADIYETEDHLGRSIAIWKKVLRIRPDLWDVYAWLADLYVRANRAPDARRLYREVIPELKGRKHGGLVKFFESRLEDLEPKPARVAAPKGESGSSAPRSRVPRRGASRPAPATKAVRQAETSGRADKKRHYHINIFWSDEDEHYVAEIPDLKGCSASASTPLKALAGLEKARAAWLEAARAEGKPVPEPRYRARQRRTS